MPFLEKTDSAQMLESGDDVTVNGIRGTVMDTDYRRVVLGIDTGRGVETVALDVDGGSVVIYGDQDGEFEPETYGVDFAVKGDKVEAQGIRGDLTSIVYTDIVATIATGEGLVNLELTGMEPVTYHNWFEHLDPECRVCLKGQHHGPKETRCYCCGRDEALWDFDFIPTQADGCA